MLAALPEAVQAEIEVHLDHFFTCSTGWETVSLRWTPPEANRAANSKVQRSKQNITAAHSSPWMSSDQQVSRSAWRSSKNISSMFAADGSLEDGGKSKVPGTILGYVHISLKGPNTMFSARLQPGADLSMTEQNRSDVCDLLGSVLLIII